ncbi:MAG: hypothetical protein AB8C46_15240 [Burkholderiaceae bacterium]
MRVLLALIVCLVTAMSMAGAEQSAVQGATQEKTHAGASLVLTVDKTKIGIAERLRYLLVVEADASLTADFDGIGETLGSFQVVERNPFGPIALPENRLRWQREYVLLPTDTGASEVPALSVAFVPPRATCLSADDCELSAHGRRSTDFRPVQPIFTLTTDALSIQVDTVLPADVDLTRPRDVLAPVSLAQSQATTSAGGKWGWVAAAIATMMLAAFGHLRKRSTGSDIDRSVIAAPDPAALALSALDRLRNEKLPRDGKHDEHCSRLSDILRDYVHDGFNIPAHELTTGELSRAVSQHTALRAEQGNLDRVLSRMDLARFGHEYPEPDLSLNLVAQAEDFVRASALGRTS